MNSEDIGRRRFLTAATGAAAFTILKPQLVHGMAANSGDLIHADRHGAVVVPVEKVDEMAAALDALMKQEARIIAAAKSGQGVEAIGFGFEPLGGSDGS